MDIDAADVVIQLLRPDMQYRKAIVSRHEIQWYLYVRVYDIIYNIVFQFTFW